MPNLQGGHGMQSSMMQPKNSKSPIGGGLDHIGSQIIGEHRRNTQEDVSNLYWGFITILLTLSFFFRWTPLCLQHVSMKVVFRMRVREEPLQKSSNLTNNNSVILSTSSITNSHRCCNNRGDRQVTLAVIWCTEMAYKQQDVKDIMSHFKRWNKH